MGDEPYAVLLPWIFFAVVARAEGEGVVWGSLAALIAAITLLSTSRRPAGDARNLLIIGAIVWFVGLGIAGWLHDDPQGWLAHNGRVVSALGYAFISFASIAYRPVTEFYSRAHVRPRLWHDARFARLNIQLTLLWGVTFVGIAASHYVAYALDIDPAYTIFNWVLPIMLCVLAAHRARLYWDDFSDANDEAEHGIDALRNLGLDWDAGAREPME